MVSVVLLFAILVLPFLFSVSNTLIFPKAVTPFESFPIPNELPETEKVTAIILNYKRFENVQIIVDHLCRVDYITEILVWNNNVDVRLEFEVSRFHFIILSGWKKTITARVINVESFGHEFHNAVYRFTLSNSTSETANL
ncbi:hypothetical protein BKA69DRAFT_1054655 [Paraphysoderma sedebokerense]|nr:hypothetical protein BKA69DRAFT_1054655 [Paraphysoderma sedebokerense]